MPRKSYTFHLIYKITNLLTLEYYIGMHSTNSLEDSYMGSGVRLRRSIRKYGIENFKREILEFLPDRESLRAREREIVNYTLLLDELCINLSIGGADAPLSNLGSKRSAETRLKMSQWIRSKELGRKISKKLSGKKLSSGHCQAISEAKTGKSNPKKAEQMRGSVLSDSSKKKISEKLSGRKLSSETREKMSAAALRQPERAERMRKMNNDRRLKLEDFDWSKIQEAHRSLCFSDIRARFSIPFRLFAEAEEQGLFSRIKHKHSRKKRS